MSDAIERVFDAVAETAPEVRSGLVGRRTYETAENPSGEQMLAADRHADELLEERLLAIDGVASYASEEREAVQFAGEEADVDDGDTAYDEASANDRNTATDEDSTADDGDGTTADAGQYHVAVDPLDGSSNLKSNNAMGTIVGVYDEALPARGEHLVGAAYVLYGPITTMVAAVDGEVTEYVLEAGERRVDESDVSIPDDPTVYGFGGRRSDWTDGFDAFVRGEIESDPSIKLRYGGAMIADVNQVVTYGGVFGYPALESAPEGKLRLQFECNPIAYIVESAGGRSSDGDRSVLSVEPTDLHQRTPVFLGTGSLIDRLETSLAG